MKAGANTAGRVTVVIPVRDRAEMLRRAVEMDQAEEAAAAFSRAIEINPDLHAAYNNLGYAFYRQGDYEQAVEMYNEALGRSSKSSSAYTNLGNAYYKMDRKSEAREAWEKALDLDPGNEKASRNIKRLERE